MSKEIVDLFEYILDQIEPRWRLNEAVVETLDKIREDKRFKRPTLQEVEDYLRSKRIRDPKGNALKWFNFYESKGWMVGKNKMKNWKSAVNTWQFEKDNLII